MSSLRILSQVPRLARSTSITVPTTQYALRSSAPICQKSWTCKTRSFSAVSSLREKYYTETHEWIELDAEKKTGSIGISAHAASALGDIVFVELPESGAELKEGDSMGAVESVKSASDLYVPVAGTISETNKKLEETPGLINKSPESEGWIAKITLEEGEADRVEGLMNAEDYKKFSE